jgi:GAF domain-containing protein
MHHESLLVRTFVELADALVDDFDVVELLSLLVDRCVDVIQVDAAGIMLVAPGGSLRVMASTTHVMRMLELFQLQAQEGPCFDCFTTGEPVVNHDLDDADDRWPRFAPQARAEGFHSVHALPLKVRGNVIGALNMFHEGRGVMDDGDVAVAQTLADIATLGIIQHRMADEVQQLTEQLGNALNSRIATEQAKGMLAESMGLEMHDAFDLLRTQSRDRGVRLSDLAQDLVEGTLPISSLAPAVQPEDVRASQDADRPQW